MRSRLERKPAGQGNGWSAWHALYTTDVERAPDGKAIMPTMTARYAGALRRRHPWDRELESWHRQIGKRARPYYITHLIAWNWTATPAPSRRPAGTVRSGIGLPAGQEALRLQAHYLALRHRKDGLPFPMTMTFEIGDRVSWNSEAGRVSGRIVRVHTRDVNYKGYVHHASRDDPQYEIMSDRTDHVALHKGKALRHLRR